MTDYPQRVAESFGERKRLIRLRRKKERLRFSDELRIIPRWLIVLVALLYVLAVFIAIAANLATRNDPQSNDVFPPELRDHPVLASLAVAGMATAISLVLAFIIFLVAYVNRDASRRGMSTVLWTILVIILLPAWGFIGFVIYFLMREPLPYPCPQCGTTVGARFNFCPNCKCNLHPSCPQCKHEVGELDKYCPNCGNDLKSSESSGVGSPSPSAA